MLSGIGGRSWQEAHEVVKVDIPDLSKRTPANSNNCDPDTNPACPQPNSGSSSTSSTSSSSSSSSDSGKSCNSATNPSCGKGAGQNNITLPVLLGILYVTFLAPKYRESDAVNRIPLVGAIVVFIWLHRRHVKKLRREDAMDPHKSLDFGWDPDVHSSRNRKKGQKEGPQVVEGNIVDEKHPRRLRGLSMDANMGSPYVLPPALHGSRESLHSMSRTIHGGDDRYRPATTFIPNDGTSMRSFPTRAGADDNSSSAGSASSKRNIGHDGMNQNLLRNAQRMSQSMPPTSRTPPIEMPRKEVATTGSSTSQAAGNLAPAGGVDSRYSYVSNDGAALRKSNNYLGAFIHSREPSSDLVASAPLRKPSPPTPSQDENVVGASSEPVTGLRETSRPPRLQSLKAVPQNGKEPKFWDSKSEFGDTFKVTPPSPVTDSVPPAPPAKNSPIPGEDTAASSADYHEDLYDPVSGIDFRRFSMGMRPLPPEDPSDNPEQRANRIRSFYKEYFDDSKPGPGQAVNQYHGDYDEGYLDNGTVYDPNSGKFVVAQRPYAEPVGRRAMTPPPRAPPRFQGPGNRPPRHHAATMSGGLTPPGPRAFSSASGRFGSPRGGPPKKALPPPGPLQILPSPHLLNEDSFALPIDFAPPTTYRDRVAGRPESPRGGQRPFSPGAPIARPLVSSFDDLSVMPSP